MYEEFYGLRERPFDLTANPRYLLLTPMHEEALSNLEYGILTGNGITLLLGDAGTGKTTLIRRVLTSHVGLTEHRRAAHAAHLTNPGLSAAEFIEFLREAFQLDSAAGPSKVAFLRVFEQALADRRERGILSLLVIDEAQGLCDELLEEVRLLANIETETEKLLRVVLAGQPALADRLNEPRFLHLKQRIGLRCRLGALDLPATAVYIAHRLRLAGGEAAHAFTREAVIAIYEWSQGIPRIINVICHNALLTGFAADQRPVTAEIVMEVCRDFDLETAGEQPPPALHPIDIAERAGEAEPPQPLWHSWSEAGHRR